MQKVKIYIDLYDKLRNPIKRVMIMRIYADTYNKNQIHEIETYSSTDSKYEKNYKLDPILKYYKDKYNSNFEDLYIEEYYLDGYDNNDITISNKAPMSPIDNKPMYANDNPISKVLHNNLQF